MIIILGHTEATFPKIIQVGHGTNSTHKACKNPTQQDKT